MKKILFITGLILSILFEQPVQAQMYGVQRINIKVNHKLYSVVLENNVTAETFSRYLPMTLNMEDLHGIEKYTYLTEKLPAQPQCTDLLNVGDVMLWGDDCLVLFYNNASTVDGYTKIGHIENAEDLAVTLGKGSVNIDWF